LHLIRSVVIGDVVVVVVVVAVVVDEKTIFHLLQYFTFLRP